MGLMGPIGLMGYASGLALSEVKDEGLDVAVAIAHFDAIELEVGAEGTDGGTGLGIVEGIRSSEEELRLVVSGEDDRRGDADEVHVGRCDGAVGIVVGDGDIGERRVDEVAGEGISSVVAVGFLPSNDKRYASADTGDGSLACCRCEVQRQRTFAEAGAAQRTDVCVAKMV